MIPVDSVRFSEARARVLSEAEEEGGIGTLAEKSLHKILKYYLEPRTECHEVQTLGSVADIKNEDGIIEIQTRLFDRLPKKLEKFLPEYKTAVVYPIITEKNLVWLDRDSGEMSEMKRSPKHGRLTDVLPELFHLVPYFGDGRLTVVLVLLTATEYKNLDGYGKARKNHATRIDRLPTAIIDTVELRDASDVAALVEGLPAEFSAKDLDRLTALRGRRAYYALRCLLALGVIKRTGKRGRAYTYSLTESFFKKE